MYQALYRKYRPRKFEDVVGQDVIIQTLKNSISSQKISHAYIFTGPRGSGKTSVAKILARTVNCQNLNGSEACNECVNCTQINSQNMDIIEIDAASNNGIDEIREINSKVNLVPSLGKFKIYIIDEVHMLTIGAFNALLKTLEEPPAHIIFILATTDPQKVPMTILSRCQRFDFKKISEEKIAERLKLIVKEENIKIEDKAIFEIARLCDGSLRDALGVLDQVITYSKDNITIKDVHDINGTVTQKDLQNIVSNIIDSNIGDVLKDLDNYGNNGKNIPKVTEEIIFLIRNIILYKSAPNYVRCDIEDFKLTAEKITIKELLEYITIFSDSLSTMKKSINSKMVLELAFIKIYSSMGNNSIEKIQKPEQMKEITKIIEESKQIENETKQNINEKKNESKPVIIEKISQEIKGEDEFEKEMENFKKIRIGNALAKFSKTKTAELRKEVKALSESLLDEKIGTYVELLLDGEIKAASEETIIYIFKTKALAETFNENINKLEKILKKPLNKQYLIIATDNADWETIKQDFNSKKIIYEYQEETNKLEDILKKKKANGNNFNNMFGELLEYK